MGASPPQYLFENRRFIGIALEPPDRNPGSWTGAGKALRDPESGLFYLSARPRKAEGGVRGYAAEIHRSEDGVGFERVGLVTKEEASAASGIGIYSIEGTQLLRDPATRKWHFYISVDTGESFVWGGIQWETLLLTSTSLEGPWESQGIVLAHDQDYDANQARDSSIDIVDGLWICLYKAMDGRRNVRPALALSNDGVHWRKRGPLTVDGGDHIAFLNGSLVPGCTGPLFVGLESSLADGRQKSDEVVYADEHGIGHGSSDTFAVAYLLDHRAGNLEPLYRVYWEPGSRYEHPRYPLLGYSSIIWDEPRSRYLIYVEAIDAELTKRIGINETVERVLVYESSLPTGPGG
jgi:hypothetical protein